MLESDHVPTPHWVVTSRNVAHTTHTHITNTHHNTISLPITTKVVDGDGGGCAERERQARARVLCLQRVLQGLEVLFGCFAAKHPKSARNTRYSPVGSRSPATQNHIGTTGCVVTRLFVVNTRLFLSNRRDSLVAAPMAHPPFVISMRVFPVSPHPHAVAPC